jgi:hypothetical protein
MRSSAKTIALFTAVGVGMITLGLPSLAAAQIADLSMVSETPALCRVSGPLLATQTTNVQASAESITGVTLRIVNIAAADGTMLDFGATVALPVFCNGLGTDYTVESINGGLVNPQPSLIGNAAANFDLRALYAFSVDYNGQVTNGDGAGPVDNGTAAATGTVAVGTNLGPFSGDVIVTIDGQPGQPLVAGSYSDTLRITIAAQS